MHTSTRLQVWTDKNTACEHTCTPPPTVQSSAPLSCVSPPGVAGRLFLAICVKQKNIAIRTVRSADVKTRSSADRAQLYLRTALKGEYLGQGGGGFLFRAERLCYVWRYVFLTSPTTSCSFLASVGRVESPGPDRQQRHQQILYIIFGRDWHLFLKLTGFAWAASGTVCLRSVWACWMTETCIKLDIEWPFESTGCMKTDRSGFVFLFKVKFIYPNTCQSLGCLLLRC